MPPAPGPAPPPPVCGRLYASRAVMRLSLDGDGCSLNGDLREQLDAQVVDADAAVGAGASERVVEACAVAAVDADLAGAAVEVLQRVRIGGQEQYPGPVEAVRVGLADPLADREQARRGRSGLLPDDRPVDVDDLAFALDRHGAAADGDNDPPIRACEPGAVGGDPGGGAVGSLGEPHSQPEL